MAKETVEIKLVKTEAGFRRALKQVSNFFNHPPASYRFSAKLLSPHDIRGVRMR